MNSWTIGSLLRHMRATLTSAGLDDADLDARFLLQFALNMTHVEILRKSADSLDHRTVEQVLALLARREWREPLAHILGTAEFYGREFISSRDALVPRKETEQLVEEALARLPKSGIVLDLACGSGCIGLTIALERPGITVHLSDASEPALNLARKNCEKLGASAEFFHGSWFEPLPAGQTYNAILTNPPYIFLDEEETLAAEVRADPREALFHPDPIGLYRMLFEEGARRLKPGGIMIAETSPRIAREFKGQFQILRDYAGLDRMIWMQKPQQLSNLLA